MRLKGLKGIREKTEKTQTRVADDLGVIIGTYRNWEQLVSSPRSKELEMLADYFGCTTDALLGRTPKQVAVSQKDNHYILQDDEQKIIEIYRKVNTKGKESMLRNAYEVSQVPQYKKGYKHKMAESA
jgi:transcriptional regulator with XRE-family HTH domain